MRQYQVTGMHCAACQARVERAVQAVDGVTLCEVSLLTNSMRVDGTADTHMIVQAVEAAGYGALEWDETDRSLKSYEKNLQDTESVKLKKRLLGSLVVLLILMYFSMGHMMLGWPVPAALMENPPFRMGILQLVLSLAILCINSAFFRNGIKSLLRGGPNMDTLVALGAGTSFIYSLVQLLLGHTEWYFESAAMIVTLITVGKLLEARSKGKTTNALKQLLELAPQTARVITDGKEQIVPADQVKVGDLILVKPGEKIPVDGLVEEGSSAVDEAAMTGESIPVDKTIGDKICAGTINGFGVLECRATGVGTDTSLAQIIRMVSDAAATKAPIAKIADRVSGVFVPIVLGIAAITFVIWLLCGASVAIALTRGISVLVISCPCALGLATPVAIMVGSGVGAKKGILFKTAVSLEETGRAQIVLLDKTGTITQGKPVVTDFLPVCPEREEELLLMAYVLEEKSEHPLAQAIVAYGKEHLLPEREALVLQDFRVLPGNGVEAYLLETNSEVAAHGKRVKLLGGNAQLMQKQGVMLSDRLLQQAEQLAMEGKTPLFFAKNQDVLGVFAVADTMKEEAPAAVELLQNMGLQVVMLTGDHLKTAQAIGKKVGITHLAAGVRPENKEEIVRTLQEYGKVIMVGDGINDAPALTRAHIGMAIGAGTDVAIEAADVVLVKSRLTDVPAAIYLSRQTLVHIKQNLFWAFFYNLIGIPLAAGLWYPIFGWNIPPMFGAAAMSLSSFCVVSNALLLNLIKLELPNLQKRFAGRKLHVNAGQEDAKQVSAMQIAMALQAFEESRIQKEIQEENKTMNKKMTIEGMMCKHCEAAVKKALESVEGVSEAQVSHETGIALISCIETVTDDVLIQAVTDRDYKVLGVENN